MPKSFTSTNYWDTMLAMHQSFVTTALPPLPPPPPPPPHTPTGKGEDYDFSFQSPVIRPTIKGQTGGPFALPFAIENLPGERILRCRNTIKLPHTLAQLSPTFPHRLGFTNDCCISMHHNDKAIIIKKHVMLHILKSHVSSVTNPKDRFPPKSQHVSKS